MGRTLILDTSRPPESIDAYLAEPSGTPKGGIVVIQEIFGVNAHIRSVADRFAEEGYVAIAPSLFDPVEKKVELGYDQEGMQKGVKLIGELGLLRPTQDVAIAEADVDQTEALHSARSTVEERDRRPCGEGPAVDPGQIVQHLLIDRRIEVRRVHLLILA